MIQIGVMQGRLLPPEQGRFQSFPADRWRDEFVLARKAGLACIEWIYEKPNDDRNPLANDAGLAEMKHQATAAGVAVRSICADYYMTERLIDADGRPVRANIEHLRWLIGRAARLGATYIVLPFVDSSSLCGDAERAALPLILAQVLPDAEAAGIELHLETDLPPEALRAQLANIGHPLVKANYDIGNSASLGFDCRVELPAIAPWLGSVHIKDRVRNGGTVPLGAGAADVPTALALCRRAGFDRWYILQVARGEPGDEVAWCSANRQWVERQFAALEIA